MRNSLNDLSAIYLSKIAEEDEDRVAITPEDAAAVSKHTRAIKYLARSEDLTMNRAYNQYVGQNNLTATQRRITKQKLGLLEEVGITSTEKMKKATKEAQLRKKEQEAVKKVKKEEIESSNWREELKEIIDMPSTGLKPRKRPRTDVKSQEKITEKPINNKVIINPTVGQVMASFDHELQSMGGQLLEVLEVKESIVDQVPPSPQELLIQKRMANLNMRLARKNREKLGKIKKTDLDTSKKGVKEELSDRAKKEVERDEKNVDNPLYKPGRRTVKQLAYARELALKKKKVDEGVGRAAIGAGVGAIVGGPVGAAAGAALGASMGKKKVTGTVQKKKPVDIADPHGNVAKAKKKSVGESRDSAGGDLDKEPPSWASMNPEDRGNPAYMKTSSLKDEEKWKRLQRMRKASKKKEVRAKANEEVEVGEAYKAVTNTPDSLAKMNKRYKPVKKIKNPTDRPFRDRLKDPDYKVDVDEEKKPLPKVKMYRKAGNLGREALSGSETGKERSKKIIKVLNKYTADGYKKAALDKLRDGSSPKHQTEDKAFANVVAALKKKHGDAGVLSSKKDFDDHKKREASKPKPKAQPQKPLTDKEKAHREVVARYGGESNYKAGRGLGT